MRFFDDLGILVLFYFVISACIKMTAHDDTQIHDEDLELEEVDSDTLEGQVEADMHDMDEQFSAQQKEIEKLTSIAGQTQRQYYQLKMDFDSYQKRMDSQQHDAKRDALINVVWKLLPSIDQLLQTVDHIPEELEWHAWATWVSMVKDGIMKELWSMDVHYVSYLWETPMADRVEPIGVKEGEKDMQWKIVQEVQQCVVYRDEEWEKVVRSAKVLLWS